MLASLDLLAAIASLVKKRRLRSLWKWIVVGVYDALQGAMVCAIADTTSANVLGKKSAAKMLDWLGDTSKEFPLEYLADFFMLFDRTAIALSPGDAKDIKRLHRLRKNFMHFTPKSWSIELEGLPRIIDAALRLIERLIQSDRVVRCMTGNKRRRLRFDIQTVRAALSITC